MFDRVRHRRFGLGVTLALVLALLLGGFAHRGPVLSASLVAFAAAGGEIGDICATPDGKPARHEDCAACRLIGAATVPDRAGLVIVQRVRADVTAQPGAQQTADAGRHPPAPPVRGPPQA